MIYFCSPLVGCGLTLTACDPKLLMMPERVGSGNNGRIFLATRSNSVRRDAVAREGIPNRRICSRRQTGGRIHLSRCHVPGREWIVDGALIHRAAESIGPDDLRPEIMRSSHLAS